MNIIIIGCGKVGSELAMQLSQEDHDICVIDQNDSRIRKLTESYDIMGIKGNGCNYAVLQEAGIANADLLIAVTESDELNLLACVIAKKVEKCHTIARVRNPVYEAESDLLKRELGISMIINPELWAAQEMFSVLCFPNAIEVDTFSRGQVQMMRFRIPAGSVLDEMRIAEVSQNLNSNLLICSVESKGEVCIPGGDVVLHSGDIITIFSSRRNALDFFHSIKASKNPVKNTMIIGGGNITIYLARMLTRAGIQVKIIEKDSRKCDALCSVLPEATIINGDGSDKEILKEERIGSMDAFVALTDFDEENILLSLFAQKMVDKKVVTKINRLQLNEVIYNLDLDSVIYPKDITTEKILQYVRAKNNSSGSHIQTLYRINEDRVEVIEFSIKNKSSITNTPLSELNLKDNIIVASIIRSGKMILPKGKDMILPGDSIIIATTRLGLDDARDIIKN